MKDLFRQDLITKPSSVSIGLYHDGEVSGDTTNGDDLSDSDNVGAISTEPQGSNYNRQTATFDSSDFSIQDNPSANWEAIISDVTFTTDDSSQDIDAYFILVSFNSTEAGTDQDQLYFTGPLDQLYDLNSVDQFTLQGAGLEVN